MNPEEMPKWKYFIPFYGLYVTYKSPEPNKGKWWAVSIIVTLISLATIGGGDKKEKENHEAQVVQEVAGDIAKPEVNLAQNIKIQKCNCTIRKKKTRDAEYAAGVRIIDAKYEDNLFCVATFRNDGLKKIDQGFKVTWSMFTKTGALIDSNSSEVSEYLPPKVPVTWEFEEGFLFNEDKATDIKKRLSKTECLLDNLREIN